MKFIDSDPILTGQEKIDSQNTTNHLIEDIIKMKTMYKEIRDGPEEDVIDDPKEGIKQNNDIKYNYKKRIMRIFVDFDNKEIQKEYIKEKYIVTKKEIICKEVEVPLPLSSEEQKKRNKYIEKENKPFESLEDYKKIQRKNTKNLKEYQYFKNQESEPYKTESTETIAEEWIEEDVNKTESVSNGHKIDYTAYEYKEKIKNNYGSFEIIGVKSL